MTILTIFKTPSNFPLQYKNFSTKLKILKIIIFRWKSHFNLDSRLLVKVHLSDSPFTDIQVLHIIDLQVFDVQTFG